ncbi:MAG TPA: glycosyltransferase family 2 protein [Thermoanaerobaculia bacterium]|nr:glycosyltransferase family 2 protein [Thermoanaerobaculia bacterium]
MPAPPDEIAVVLVTHNDRARLLDALVSVRNAEVVVVDNASTDGTAEVVRRAFPEVRLLESPNDGYGAAANRGIAACSAPFVLLLNSDVVVRPGALRALAGYLASHPRAGLAGPRLENPDGTLQRSCFDFLGTARLAIEKTALGRMLGGWSVHYGPYDRPRTSPWVLGAALAIRREAFEAVGGFDPAFFLYGEEVDLCYRLWQAGWEIHYTPSAAVMHVGGSSTAARSRFEVQRVESARLFYRKHYPPLRAAILDGLIRTAMRLRWLRDSLRLRLVRDDRRRSRLAQDLAVWRGVLKTD